MIARGFAESTPISGVRTPNVSFEPATASDALAWPGIPKPREAIGRLRPRLRSCRDGSGRELLDVADGGSHLPTNQRRLASSASTTTPSPAHADRSPDHRRHSPASGLGQARVALFVDGYLTGAWRLLGRGSPARVELEAHRPRSRAARDQVDREAAELARFLALGEAKLEVPWVDGSARHSRRGS